MIRHRLLVAGCCAAALFAAPAAHSSPDDPAQADASPPAPVAVTQTAAAVAEDAAAPDAPDAVAEEVAEAVGPGTAVVEELHATLLDIMRRAEELGYTGRYERLAPVMPSLFDLDFMAEKSVGRHWRTASAEHRAQLLATVRRFTTANYAGRFDGFSGQSFETIDEKPAARDTVMVRTRLLLPDDEPVQLNYRLRRVADGWKIIDVYLNGTVSELALRRSEYSSLIERDGFDALIAALDKKIEDLKTTPAAQP